ncbi:hypothetical protein [Haloechinothrix halophila]|uniref:hypothetical protein n=1 Tax=Haloechinothrix halophila TaxID=1069073 RepID=UPI0018C8A290|nr:hypothetical protein [Haloechinothrix halophila]
MSPEACAAYACYAAIDDVRASIAGSASGVELISCGFGEDVTIATEVDACATVPVLTDGVFIGDATLGGS